MILRNQNNYINIVSIFVFLMVVIMLGYSCKKKSCTPKIRCHYFDDLGNVLVGEQTYCPDEEPPCDCQDINGNIISSAGGNNQFSVTTCSSCLYPSFFPSICGTSGSSINISNPYFTRNHTTATLSNNIKPEYANYFYDNSVSSPDKTSRPVYFEFNVFPIVVASDILKFEIKYVVSSQIIATQEAILNSCGCTGFLRSFFETPVGSDVQGQGTLKMDISQAVNKEGSYEILMYKNSSLIATGNFNVTFSDNVYTERCLDLKLFKTPTKNYTNYFIGGISFATGLTNVFGQGKSNIRFVGLTPTTLDASLIDNNENALLNFTTFNFFSGRWEYEKGFNDWMEKLYAKHGLGTTYDNITAVVELQFMKRWDFGNGMEDQIDGAAFNTWMDEPAQLSLTGLTSEDNPLFTAFFSGCVVLRRNINGLFTNTFNTNVTAEGIVLETIYHELGHCWGEETSAGNLSLSSQCDFHTSYCTGYNKTKCLWHYCDAYINDIVSWMNDAISNPTYCEGHQQIFMNQLRPKI